MREKLRFLGMDVHAETIAVAIAEPDEEVRSLGTIANREDSIRKFIRKLGTPEQVRACYETGPAPKLPDLAANKRILCLTENRVRENHDCESPFFSGAAGRSPVSVRSNNISLIFRHLWYDASPSQTEPALSSLTISRLAVRVRR